jgi:hypothetical protein
MRRRRYAQETTVQVGRSRGEIDNLLRQWGAKGIQWSDDFEHDRVILRFVWNYEGTDYMARFVIELPGKEDLKDEAIDGRTGAVSDLKMEKLLAARGKQEHRLLLLWLKAALNAVDAGMVSAETLFLPFLEGQTGETVAEIAIPNLKKLASGSAMKLLST